MNTTPTARRIFAVLLFLAIAATAWLSLHESLRLVGRGSRHGIVFNPGYQHSQRLQVATARAAMDAVGMNGTTNAAGYRTDYRLQRMQIQADSEGLERWAANDPRHQGLLLEIRASLTALSMALNEATGQVSGKAGASAVAAASGASLPLLSALNHAQSALSNYSASLTEPRHVSTGHYIFAAPVRIWWLLILLLVEAAALAWLGFSMPELI